MKLRISSKMLAGFLMMMGIVLIGGALTILFTYRLQSMTTQLLVENVSNLKAARELEVTLFRMRGLTFNYIVDGKLGWISSLKKRQEEFLSWLKEAMENTRSEKELELLLSISSLFNDFEKKLNEAQQLNQQSKTEQAKSILLRTSRDLFDTIYEKCEIFVSINENAMFAAEDTLNRMNSTVRKSIYGLIIGGMILGVSLGLVISRSIINPIYELVLKVRGAAGKEFVERIDLVEGTELEELDQLVHALIGRINTAMTDLERNRQLLAQSEKLASLGKISAGVAHEIRNPLTSIKMLIYSLREELKYDEEKKNDLDVIVKEIDQMDRVVKNFLQFARPPEPNYEPTDINLIVHEMLELLEPRLRQNHITLAESYQSDLQKIPADADQLKQLVLNLVLNAIDSMPSGGQLKIETLRVQNKENRDWVEIKIFDTGSGIPQEIKDTLFDPFVSGREAGIGLGLSIAHQIMQQHGGWIDVQDNPDGGTIFIIALPIQSKEA